MYADKVGGFVVPIKDAVAGLLGHFPDVKAFAGSEDLADSDEASAGAEGAAMVPLRQGRWACWIALRTSRNP